MTKRWGGLRLLAAVLVVCVFLAGCATRGEPAASGGSAQSDSETADPSAAFDVDVRAPNEVQDYLLRHLELMRYRQLRDLDNTELERLRLAAEANVRELLATLGYFSPQIDIRQDRALEPGAPPPQITVSVEPGQPIIVSSVDIGFAGAIDDDPEAAAQRAAIRSEWSLAPGKFFTQQAWDDAKTGALRLLVARRYPTGSISASRAEINPETQFANLSVTLDSGPLYRFGPMRVDGVERYDPVFVERLARLPPGAPYDQTALLEAQQRLQDSGHFNSASLEIDPTGDPQAVPVVATVREAKRKRVALGVGISTDSGPRLSVEHTNHQIPVLGWRAVSKLLLDRDTQSIGSELTAPPDEGNWRWQLAGELKNEDAAGVDVRSLMLRTGRLQLGDRIDRNYYVQYDRAVTTGPGIDETAQSVTLTYAWTRRNFDNLPFPSSGYGLGVELGGGMTLSPQREPFIRTKLNWLGIWSLDRWFGDEKQAAEDRNKTAGPGRLALRAQLGAVLAKEGVVLPSTQLFLTGGDATVRGYGYQSIGAREANGVITPGRYLASGSVEWQRPIVLDGRRSDWESTVFVDAGAVADKPSELKARVGIGAGVRYRSPVGPLQVDLAYGLSSKKLRLHLAVGFTF